jgi:hypothetical protein
MRRALGAKLKFEFLDGTIPMSAYPFAKEALAHAESASPICSDLDCLLDLA